MLRDFSNTSARRATTTFLTFVCYLLITSTSFAQVLKNQVASTLASKLMNEIVSHDNTTIDPVVHQWCYSFSKLIFVDHNMWFEIQEKTVPILNAAILTRNEILTPRLYIQHDIDSSIEDTHILSFISYAIKQIYGIKPHLGSQWANGPLENRFGLLVAEVKPANKDNSSPPSDFVKLGEEMKQLLNTLVTALCPNLVIAGLLIQGLLCYTYTIYMKAEEFYVMQQLAEFTISTIPAQLSLKKFRREKKRT